MRRIRKLPFTIACDATNNTVPTTAPTKSLSGRLLGVKIKTPAAVDGAATVAVTIKDADGDTLYTKSGVAVNTTNFDLLTAANVPISTPLADVISINPIFSANQTPVRNVIVTLLYEDYVA